MNPPYQNQYDGVEGHLNPTTRKSRYKPKKFLKTGYTGLGGIFRPSDFLKGRRRFVEELTRDLDASKRETVMRILESWREGESEEEIRKILGQKLTKELLTKLKSRE